MNTHYADILSRITEPPVWWDEHAVPRFCEFNPNVVANIYARYVALVLITCQGCGVEYRVAHSQGAMDRYLGYDETGTARWVDTMDVLVQNKRLDYGDPPNNNCCGVGASMSSEPRRVLEFWERPNFTWERRPDLEIAIAPDWVR